MLSHTVRISVLTACLLALVLAGDWASLEIFGCEPYKPYPYYQADKENCTPLYIIFIEGLYRLRGLVGLWVDRNHNAILAIATVFIAGFTCALFYATRKLWVASERQAKISNRSWVFTQPWPHTIRHLADGSILFQMQFACYGNGPATVTEFCVEVSATNPDHEESVYSAAAQRVANPFNLAPKNSWLHPQGFVTTMSRPFVFGYVDYVDQFGAGHRSGYCYRFTGDPALPTAATGSLAYSRFT